MGVVYQKINEYLSKYHQGITWHRLKKHSEVVERHLNPDEIVLYAFPGQKNDSLFDVFSTCVVALTNKRILIGQKRVVFGYYCYSITPDLYNDLTIYSGLVFGKVTIDTVKEVVYLTNIDKHALPEIETEISTIMMEAKKEYRKNEE